ncbi:hypothetical protein FRC10_007233, partial [Ceratobasidium sp. 414]
EGPAAPKAPIASNVAILEFAKGSGKFREAELELKCTINVEKQSALQSKMKAWDEMGASAGDML